MRGGQRRDCGANEKGRPKAALGQYSYNVDQAAADLIARRRENPSQPSPAKPAIIMAQVEGSGTGEPPSQA